MNEVTAKFKTMDELGTIQNKLAVVGYPDAQISIVVTGTPLIAAFEPQPIMGPGPLTTQLVNKSTGNIVRWEWNCGGALTPEHTQNNHPTEWSPTVLYWHGPQSYYVQLIVWDAEGNHSNVGKYIIVT